MSTRHTVRGITQSLPLRDVSDRRSRNGWRGPVLAGLVVLLALLSGSLAASSSAAGPSKPSAPQPPDPVIQQIMDQVTTTDLMDIDSGLSGEHSVIVGGQPYTFTTRYSRNSAGIQKTWQYAYEQFQAAGWNTSYQDYTAGGYSLKNIIAEKQGTVSPNVIYLLTAHIDDTSGSPNSYAPGADDNGSGSSLLIDAARVLAQYPMSATVRIVAFTGEEQGLWGSAAYAAAARARGDNIQGVLNADMIAWDSNNDHAGEIHAGTRADSQAIASVFSNTVTTYGVPLYLNTYTTNSETGSDHSSFWQYNYPAFLAIELDRGGDFNAYYHTINDRVNCGGNNPCGFNQSYYTAFSKALVGTLARLAVAYPPGTPTPTVTGTPPTATPTFTPSNTATATPTSCSNYVYATGTATVIAGVTDIGNHTDDGVTFVTFPFPVKVYGQTYTGGNASSNGNFQFSGGQIAWQPECLPSTSFTGPTIFLYWEDLVTSCSGCGIYSTIVGTAPNREFVLEWRAQPYPSGSTLDFEMLFPEYQVVNSEEFDLVYGSVASGGAGATVGVQAGDGVHYTQFECGTGGLTENLKIVFTLPPCGTPVATSTATATHTSTAVPSPTSEASHTPRPTETETAEATETEPVPTVTEELTATRTPETEPSATGTPGATNTVPPATLTTQATETPPATATSTACAIQFSDMPEGSTFYSFVRCLACRGIISGYPDGTFRPGNQVTRGQLTKIVSNSAGWNDEIPPDRQTFEDVPPGSTFWLYVERAVLHLAASGYQCGGPGEPCVPPNNRPYFHPNAPALRGQVVKIISNAAGLSGQPSGQTFQDVDPSHPYYVFVERLAALGSLQGYPCGQVPAEPCVPPQNRPYARPYSSVTRGQATKLDANTFFPGCQTPARK